MSGAYYVRPQYGQNTIGPNPKGSAMTKLHRKSLDVIASIKAQGRGREVKVPKPKCATLPADKERTK